MSELLVVKPSSLGDIVHGLQVAETIRQRRPATRISWIAADAFAPLVRACATVNGEVFVFERRGGLAGLVRLLRAVRVRSFDAVLDLQGLARSALMTRAARTPRRIGRRDAREGAACCYDERIALPPAGATAPAVEILLQFLPALGHAAELAGALSFAPALSVRALLPPGEGPLVVMFPGSRRPEKNWPGFRALAQRLLAAAPTMRVAWAGSDASVLPPTAAAPRFVDLVGRTSLAELPELINAADVVVANDSGPMHLAAALGRTVVAVFGPTDPARFGPHPLAHPRHHVMRAPGGDLARLDATMVGDVVLRIIAEAAQSAAPRS